MVQFNRGIWNFHLLFDSWLPSLCLHHHFLMESLSILGKGDRNPAPTRKHHQQIKWTRVPLTFTQSSEFEPRTWKSLWKCHSVALRKFSSKCYYHLLHIVSLEGGLNFRVLNSFTSFHATMHFITVFQRSKVFVISRNKNCVCLCGCVGHCGSK